MAADKKQRLPRSDIPPDYQCPYPNCDWERPENKRPELTYRNHMAQVHNVYYEKAPPSDVKKSLAQYPSTSKELRELEDLKPWHCLALARHTLYGQTYKDIGKDLKHSPQTISDVAKSPAGQAFIAKCEDELKDPVRLTKKLMETDVFSKHMDWLQAWEWAMHAKDYKAIHSMAKDIGLQPAMEQKNTGPTKISLNLNMGDLGTPDVNSRFQVLEAEIVEELDGYEEGE